MTEAQQQYMKHHSQHLERTLLAALKETLRSQPPDPLRALIKGLEAQAGGAAAESPKEAAAATDDAPTDAAPAGAVKGWTAEGWVGALHAVEPVVAKALVGGAADELAALRALGASADKNALSRRLGEANINDTLAEALLPRLQELAAPPAAAGDLQAKFAEGASFDLKYGDLSTFFRGLEGKIGAPDPKVEEAVEREHTASADSQAEFVSTRRDLNREVPCVCFAAEGCDPHSGELRRHYEPQDGVALRRVARLAGEVAARGEVGGGAGEAAQAAANGRSTQVIRSAERAAQVAGRAATHRD